MSPHANSAHRNAVRTPEFDSHLLREVRSFCLHRSRLNPFGARSVSQKRLAGTKPLSYQDAIAAIRLARREGERRGGIGAQLAAVMLNAIVFDSLEPGEEPDVVAVPCERPSAPVAVKPPELEELEYVRATSELHTTLAQLAADGLSEFERGRLRRIKGRVDREFDDVLRAHAIREVRR